MADFSKDREEFWKNIQNSYYKTNTKRVPRDLVYDFVKNNDVSSVLELGCNSGGNLLKISKSFPDVRLVGIDICERAIEHGKTVEKNPAELQVGSIYDLSRFDDCGFDLVFTRGVLLHINHEMTPKVIKDMLRISNRYILHIERHGESEVRSYSGEIPHSFSHDFEQIYSALGMVPKITDTYELTRRVARGGDDHFILADKVEKQ